MPARPLATNITNYASGALGLVELAGSYLQDRKQRAFSKAELSVWINEAQDELATIINNVYREFFVTSATTPTVSGQSLYSLPTDLAEFIKAEVVDNTTTDGEPQDLVEILLDDKRFYERLDAANEKGKYGYFFLQGHNFRLVPGAASSNQYVRIFYVQRLTPLTADGDVSVIPAQHHELLAIGAAKRANAKHEKINLALERLEERRLAVMRDDVARFSRNREKGRRPWYGSYGPPTGSPAGWLS